MMRGALLGLVLAGILAITAPAGAFAPGATRLPPDLRARYGMASWYGPGFDGRRMANGERFNQWGDSAASRTLPFGTRVRVRNLRNGLVAIVIIRDRGPYVPGRIIDLSRGTARLLQAEAAGVVPVEVAPLP